MFKNILSFVLAGLLLNTIVISPAYAESKQEKEIRLIEKIKENVRKIGTGPEARVEVKLLDSRKLKGHVREAGEDGFVVVDAKTGTATTVAYGQVKQIRGSNHLTAAKVGLTIVKGVAIVAGVAAAFTLLGYIALSQGD